MSDSAGQMQAGPESGPVPPEQPLSAAASRSDRIGADSFRQLAARLKLSTPAAIPVSSAPAARIRVPEFPFRNKDKPLPPVPSLFPERPPEPVVAEAPSPPKAEPAAAEFAAPEPAEERAAAPADEPAIELPVFAPLKPFDAEALPPLELPEEPEALAEQEPAEQEPVLSAPDSVVEPVPITADNEEVPAVELTRIEPDPEPAPADEFTGPEPIAEIAQSEAPEPEALAEAIEIEPETLPEAEPAVAASYEENLAPFEAAPIEAEEPEPQPVEEEPLVETAPLEELEAALNIEAAEPEAVEPAEDPWALPIKEPELEPVSFTAEAPVAEPEPELPAAVAEVEEQHHESEEPAKRLRKGNLAERVFEAMIKTVTEAIYSRPTNEERAAFLREMAELGELASPTAPDVLPQAEQRPIEEIPEALTETLTERLGPTSTTILKSAEETLSTDPFSRTPDAAARLAVKTVEPEETDEESGELAISLLDMMASHAGTSQPQERALASDTLLRILPRVPVKGLITIAERLTIMEQPPALLMAKLIRDPRPEVVAPLLERCMHITDQDLMMAATEGDTTKRRMIARRRVLSPVLADHLISFDDTSVLLTLIRNPGAAFSHEAFYKLAEEASRHHSLLAPLTTRAELPAPVAFELFWFVPTELRRFILSRFLTDSETLNRILKITRSTQEGDDGKFPNPELLEQVIEHCVKGDIENAAQLLAELANIADDTANRIISDRQGEPLAVALKALGYPRSKFEGALALLQHCDMPLIRQDRNSAELQAIFDTLSFNKARMLITYWDWFVLKTGPYAPHA